MFGGFIGFAYLCRLMKPTNDLNIRKSIAIMVLAATFAACSGDSTDTPTNGYNDGPTNPSGVTEEIRVNADVFQMMDGTRTTTYDSPTSIQTEGNSFFCKAYDAGTTTINTTSNVNSQVNWNSSTSSWAFADGTHNWPESGDLDLDFFAYMPATKPDYIKTITYAVSGSPATPHPSFTCDMRATVETEFIYALTPGQNRPSNISGVNLAFCHPFAKIIFQLSGASGTAVTINSITINGSDFYKKAKCTFDGTTSTWSEKDDDTKGSLGTLSINTPYIVIPNNYGSKTITVNATWDEWSSFTTDVTSSAVSINWQAGYSYTYTLTLSKYALDVNTSKYTEQW